MEICPQYLADCVGQAHTRIDWKTSKEVVEDLDFFSFFFPFPEECDDSLWLKLVYDFHWETANAPKPVQLPA